MSFLRSSKNVISAAGLFDVLTPYACAFIGCEHELIFLHEHQEVYRWRALLSTAGNWYGAPKPEIVVRTQETLPVLPLGNWSHVPGQTVSPIKTVDCQPGWVTT
jgi:hypothetical protein